MVAGGIYEVFYGAIYQGNYVKGVFSGCGQGCSSSNSSGITVTFVDYPVWNPPSFNGADYSSTATCMVTAATYTPQNPPPKCLYPPAFMATDYSKNYGGGFLIILGALAGVSMFVGSKRQPRVNTENR